MTHRLALVLPRNMRFTPHAATAVDLCAHDYARASSLDITVFGRPVAAPFDDVTLREVHKRRGPLRHGADFAAAIAEAGADAILVEQYAPTAAALARAFPGRPVILRRHGPLKPPKGPLRRTLARRRLGRLAGVITVSSTVRQSVLAVSAIDPARVATVPNGLDVSAWTPRPAGERSPVIAFAGRLAPEKGVLEAVEATAVAVRARAGWTGRFLLADPGVHPDYRARVEAAASRAGGRIGLALARPHAEVKALFEDAAIVLVPSLWAEPFGRTAIEALAGGAALLTSATGGLAEIIDPRGGPAVAIGTEPTDRAAFAAAIGRLCDDTTARADLAVAGRHHVAEHYDIHRIAAAIDRIVVDAVDALAGRV